MSDENISYGLMVNRVMRHGRDYLEVRVMERKGDSDYPRNTSSWYAFEEKPYLEDLLMSGGVYTHDDKKASFSIDRPEFSETRGVRLPQAKAMVKTLTKIAKHMDKEQAREPGDVFMAFARAVDAQWVCIPRKARMERSCYEENRWAWYSSLTEARNAFRQVIADMVFEEQTRLNEIRSAKAA
jgi:hypothetical protein